MWALHLALWAFLVVGFVCPLASSIPSATFHQTGHILRARQVANGVALRILPLGDSITWGFRSSDGNGYRAHLRSSLAGNQVTFIGSQRSGNMDNGQSEGHPGAVISQIAEFAKQSTEQRPNVVLLMAGTNDMNIPTKPSTAPARLDALIDQILSACPDAAIAVAKIPRNSNPDAEARTQTYNTAVGDLVAKHQSAGHKVLLADMYQALSTADFDDGLHPNDGGYKKLAAVWHIAITEAAGKGWIAKPVDVDVGGGHKGQCEGHLYWDPVYGQVASGVGSGASQFPPGKWWDRGTVYEGHGKGGFIHLADLDGDGKEDYVWVHPDTGASSLYRNTGNFDKWHAVGQVSSGIGEGAGVRFADINGDGRADFLWISPEGSVRYYRNGGPSSDGKWIWFDEGIIVSGRGKRELLIFADLDGDGRADLAVLGANGSIAGFLNATPGDKPTFRTMGMVAAGDGGIEGVHLRDINGDGRADYLHVKEDGAVTAYINMLGGSFGAAPDWLPLGNIASGVGSKREDIIFGDMSGDGRADYLVVNRTSGAVKMWQNQGTGSSYRAGHNVFFADLTGSGRKDFLIVSPDGAIELYENGGSSGSMWIWHPRGQIASGVSERANIR